MSSTKHTIEELKAGAANYGCTYHIQQIRSIDYESLLIAMFFERMQRKSNDILNIFNSIAGKNWNETFYIMLLRVLGGMDNRQAMTELSRRVNSSVIMRENISVINLEALLLGASGLLELYPDDSYIKRLRLEFDHLAAKYNITPMLPGEWNLSVCYRNNHPTLRIAQLAACLHNKEFTVHNALQCTNSRDVYDLFDGKASEYWVENYIPIVHTITVNERIGQLKSDLLGINLIAPMIYTYGNYILDEDMAYSSLTLLENIAAEHNRFTKPWFKSGVEPRNAFVSQALIQLSKEYCTPRRCEECMLAKMVTK